MKIKSNFVALWCVPSVLCSLILMHGGVCAQVRPDKSAPANQQPTVFHAPNGTLLVNIQTPGEHGVSRNAYKEFDVPVGGVILNNARTPVLTQLGGWIPGNEFMPGRTARVILNEVNATDPSVLLGTIEVAGDRAQVIVANAAGITCNGCGFINAARTTLTTGAPIFKSGNLESFRVQRGNIRITGAGLDASTTDYTDVIARAIEVNAGIWARQLRLTAGANMVSADQSLVEAVASPLGGTGTAPLFAIDVSQLGGLYAGKIFLIGTEAGVGVRHAGYLGATVGEVIVTTQGRLENTGRIISTSSTSSTSVDNTGRVVVTAQEGMTNSGIVYAQTDADLRSRGEIDNTHGVVLAGRQLTVDSARLRGDGELLSQGDIHIRLADDYTHTGLLRANGNAALQTMGTITNQARIEAGAALHLKASQIHNAVEGRMQGDAVLLRATAEHALINRGLIDARSTWIDSATVKNLGSGRLYGDYITIRADVLTNAGENGQAPVIAAREHLVIGAMEIHNEGHALLASDGDIAIGGVLDAQHQTSGQASVLRNISATIDAQGQLDLAAAHIYNINTDFRTEEVSLPTQHIVEYQGVGTFNRYRPNQVSWQRKDRAIYLVTPERVYIDWLKYDFARAVTQTQVMQSDPARIASGGDMTIQADAVLNDHSHILAGGDLNATLGSLTNTAAPGQRVSTDNGRATSAHRGTYCAVRVIVGCIDREFNTDYATTAYQPLPTVVTLALSPTRYQSRTLLPASGSKPSPRVATGKVDTALLDNRLFQLRPNPASTTLIETDPAFTQYSRWLSSDSLLNTLALDPALTQKRLGDGFIEQKLLREQVAQLTGRRFLDGYNSDEAQYQALMSHAATFAQTHQLRPGIALTAAQMATLTSDIVWLVEQEVSLPDGTRTNVLVPQLYVRLKDGDLNSTGALITGDNVRLQVSGELVNGGSIAGRQILAVSAETLHNLGGRLSGTDVGLTARADLINLGGDLAASHSLTATAGRDLMVAASVHTQTSDQGSRTHLDRMATLTVSGAGGTLTAVAGRDVRLDGATVVNVPANAPAAATQPAQPGRTIIAAGNDILLGTVNERSTSQITWNASNQRHDASQTAVGSVIQTEGTLQLQAGHDVHAQAASLTSEQGAIAITAGRDLTLTTAQATRQLDEFHKNKDKLGPWSSQTITTRDHVSETAAQSSTVSGDTVTLAAGRDLRLQGSYAVSTAGTTLAADGHVMLEADTHTLEETHERTQKRSGLMGSGGMGVTIGTRTQSLDDAASRTVASGSTVGSTAGDVQIYAGKNYRQSGSDVLTPQGDIAISAQRIDITDARNSADRTSTTRFKQTGVTVALSNPIVSAAQTAQQMVKSAGNTTDTRMQMLAAANVAMAGANAYGAVQAGQPQTINGKDKQIATGKDAAGNTTSRNANAADQIGGVTLSMSVGTSSSNSTTVQTSNTATVSKIVARGNVHLAATGAGPESDLTLQGTTVRAGQSMVLHSDDALTLLAAYNTAEQHSQNKSRSASAGVAISSAGGIGMTASGSRGRGHADGTDVSWTNTQLVADQITLVSGGDTNIKGAVVKADQVTAIVQGDLAITSLQDSSRFDSRQHNAGGSVMVGTGVTGNAHFSHSQIDSDYASVAEQSGIRAGDGGFSVAVAGDTTLTGGAITSTDEAVLQQRKYFSTGGTLSTIDIANQARYTAQAVSVNVGTGMSSLGKLVPAGTAAGLGNDSESDASTTQAAISGIAHNRDARTGDTEAGLAPLFDAQRVSNEVNARVQITQAFTQQASAAVKNYMQDQRQALRARAGSTATDQEKKEVQTQLRELTRQERVLNVLIGAVTGTAGAAVAKETLSAAADQMRHLMIEDSTKFAGIGDGNAPPLSNASASSAGVRGDGVKVGGVRVDLDVVCGAANERCERNPDGSLDLNKQGLVQFNPEAAEMSLEEFLATPKAKKMVGPTGGIQGAKGSLFGVPYEVGSWQDRLIEAFSGTHDMIGGKLSGLYDEQGNIKRGMTNSERNTYDYGITTTAIIPSIPFAAAELLPPEVWNAIAVILKAAK